MSQIEIADQENVVCKVFRLFSRDGTAACKRSLCVRFDWTEKGWAVSFYSGFSIRDAIGGVDPLTKIPVELADLAIEAFRMLDLHSDIKPSTM